MVYLGEWMVHLDSMEFKYSQSLNLNPMLTKCQCLLMEAKQREGSGLEWIHLMHLRVMEQGLHY